MNLIHLKLGTYSMVTFECFNGNSPQLITYSYVSESIMKCLRYGIWNVWKFYRFSDLRLLSLGFNDITLNYIYIQLKWYNHQMCMPNAHRIGFWYGFMLINETKHIYVDWIWLRIKTKWQQSGHRFRNDKYIQQHQQMTTTLDLQMR